MKNFCTILFIFCFTFSKGQTTASICGQHACIDTLYQPLTSIYLVARINSTSSAIVSHGWSFISGPTTVPPVQNQDSAKVVFTMPGIYIFKYTATNSQGAMYSGSDMVTVIALSVISTTVNYTDGTSATSAKQIKSITKKYTNGSSSVTIIP